MIDGGDRYARLAARLLMEQPVQAAAEKPEDRRDKVIAAMVLAIEAKRRKRRTVVGAGLVLAAAAAALFMVRATRKHGSAEVSLLVEENSGLGNALVRNAVTKPLLDGARVVEGDSVQADRDGRASLALANGTRVTLSAAGRLRVDELAATRRFSLQSGRVHAQVAKLVPGERFVIGTPDTEVEVRGTVFDVTVDASCGAGASRSTVAVSEGAVWVRSGAHQAVLHPGESWTSPCPEVAAPEAEEPAVKPQMTDDAPVVRRPVATHPRRHAARAHVEQAPLTAAPVETSPAPPELAPTARPIRPESHLAEQNTLFSAAMAAEHQGDHATALGKLDQLIQRFPGGPLLESARAERSRILSAQPKR